MRSNKGFSLVELIVVIAIMAIIAAVAVPVYSAYIDKANTGADNSAAAEFVHSIVLAKAAAGQSITEANVVLTIGATGITSVQVNSEAAVSDAAGVATLTNSVFTAFPAMKKTSYSGTYKVLNGVLTAQSNS